MSRAAAGALTLATVLIAAVPARAEHAAATSLRQVVTVSWQEGRPGGMQRSAFEAPGIGVGEVVCRRDAAFIRIRPADPGAETSMWSVLTQPKRGVTQVAVHNARVYTFSTPTSTVARGTGPAAHEGLNQERPLEDAGSGSAFGLISQRTARNAPAVSGAPATSFTLRWAWAGFAPGGQRPRCHVAARLTTRMAPGVTITTRRAPGVLRLPGPAASGFGLDWHGEADAPQKGASAPAVLPSLGRLLATCEPGAGSRPGLTLLADRSAAGPVMAVTTYEGEGPDAATPSRFWTDPVTGRLGPVPLPVNGMLRATVTDGEHRATVIASSIRKTNDPQGADNFCEIAVQALSG